MNVLSPLSAKEFKIVFIAPSLENFCFQRERQSFRLLWNETEGFSYDKIAFKIHNSTNKFLETILRFFLGVGRADVTVKTSERLNASSC